MNENKLFKTLFHIKRGLLLLVIPATILSACTTQETANSTTVPNTNTNTASQMSTTPISVSGDSGAFSSEDEDAGWSSTGSTAIALKGTSIAVTGNGAAAKDSTVTITAAGTYVVSGILTSGQLVVDTQEKSPVKLVLNNADITNAAGTAIYVKNASKAVIILADGTQNHVTDGVSYVFDDAEAEEPDAAIFSKSDLSVTGSGTLTVNAVFRDGIKCKDMLRIAGGTIAVNAADCGIKGRDGIAIKSADITVNAKGDGLKSTNDTDADKGTITVLSGTLNITAGDDGIDAQTNLLVKDGNITIISGGGSANSTKTRTQENGGMGMPGKGGFNGAAAAGATNTAASDTAAIINTAAEDTTISTKGIKTGTAVQIDGGTLTVDSADDAINSGNSVVINGGAVTLTAGDDGIHADTVMQISGGGLTVNQSYEGLESSNITIDNGNIRVTASDDGVNVSGGNDGSSVNGRAGQNNFTASENGLLTINGGSMVVDAGGDGLDSNGSISMTGGTAVVNGPTNDGNGALDYNGSFKMTGGCLVAAGSSGMAQAPDSTSTQNAVMINLTSAQAAGTLVHIEDASGKDVLTFAPSKAFRSLVLCSPSLVKGSAYTVYTGGSSTGTAQDGLYTGGSYTAGTNAGSFTVSDVISSVGTVSGGFQMGGGGNPGRGPGRQMPQGG